MTSGGGAGGPASTVYIDVQGRFEEFERRLQEIEANAGSAGERTGSRFGGAVSVGLGVATGAALALGAALIGAAKSSLDLASEAAQNVDEFQSKLGTSREEAERLGAVAEQVFGDNWTGSLSEAGAAVANVRKEIKGLTDEELRSVTGGTVAIAETFEEEQGRVASAVQAVMDATGVGAQEAMDFITAGFQRGLNSSGDFLDTLMEYGPQFEKTKLPAGELFSLLETGAQKGALGTDKIADALKEFSLTVTDVNEASADTYDQLGLSQAKLVKDIDSGKLTIGDAFKLVTERLKNVKGEAERTQIIATIFGGAGEDLAAGIKDLDLTKTKLGELKGSTDQLNQRYTSLNDYVTGMWRQIQLAMLPVGKELLSLANDALPYVQKAAAWLGERLPGWIKAGIDAVKAFGTGAVNTYNTVRPAIDTAAASVQKFSAFLERNKEILIPLASGIGTVVAALAIHRVATIAATAITTAWTVATTAATAASIALRAAIAFITGPVGLAVAAITALVAAGVYLYRNWDEVKAKALAIWNQVKEIVMNALNGAVTFLRNIDLKQVAIDMIVGYVNGIRGAAQFVLQAVQNLGGVVISGIKKILRIQSPSRVMAELGEFTGQGFAQGIESEVPRVAKAAQATAAAFLDALSDLKTEQAVGKIDLGAYTRTLEQARAQLTAKLSTVKEGTPVYTEWLKALALVTKELDGVKGKTSETQKAAKGAADELQRNREQIAQGEAMERYVASLRRATDAQLSSALATARTSGEIEKYNAIKSEQNRREQEVEAATRKSADAAKQQADQLAANRKQILDGQAWEVYVEGLRGYTDQQLAAARANAIAAGDGQKFNAVLSEQKTRADEAAQAVAALAAAELAAANSAAQRDPQGAASSAYRQSYGAGDEGLIKSLAAVTGLSVQAIRDDVEAALADAKKFAPDAAALIERTWADALAHRRAVATAEKATIADTTKAEQDAYAARVQSAIDSIQRLSDAGLMELYTEAAATRDSRLMAAVILEGDRRAQEFKANLEAGVKAGADALAALDLSSLGGRDLAAAAVPLVDAQAEFEALMDRLLELRGELDTPGVAEAFVASIEDAGRAGRISAAQVGLLKDQIKDLQTLPKGPLLPDNQQGRDAPGSDQGGAWTNLMDQLSDKTAAADLAQELKILDEGQLAAAKSAALATEDAALYAAVLAEEERRVKDSDAAHKAWTDNLNKMGFDTWVKGLKDLSDAELQAALEAARAAENVTEFNAILAEIQDREINVTFKINGLDTGVKALDVYKTAINGLSGFIRDTFESLASGAGVTAGSVVKSFAVMALGVVQQIATMIAAQAALALATAILDGATLNPRVVLTAVAATAIAGIAAGFAASISRSSASVPSGSPSTTSSAPIAQEAATTASNNVVIPTTQVTVGGNADGFIKLDRAADKLLEAADVLSKGVDVRIQTESRSGRFVSLAYDLATGGL
ncbi:hypothetical protein CBQ26_09090 [Deinococcus indicus]|uniref:Phage tail tape measure protein domain-containing protein n=1 Tax=Deinococcus indicus TaxID=223556 RepID=A0A2D0A7X1_9DEIO|nr:phage tail tape measure protein [Deinococcus indicus]OWL96521.1 hypothetical protein CBQ26_09090 [Deinococcus indicus]